MPARATPIGRPMASTDPNAMIRMMIAKPNPSASDDGTRTRRTRRHRARPAALDIGTRRGSVAGLSRLFDRGVRWGLDLGVGDLPGFSPSAIWILLPLRTGWSSTGCRRSRRRRRITPSSPGGPRGRRLPARLDTMSPTWPRPDRRTGHRGCRSALALDIGSVKSALYPVPTAPVTAPMSTTPRTRDEQHLAAASKQSGQRCIRFIARYPRGVVASDGQAMNVMKTPSSSMV